MKEIVVDAPGGIRIVPAASGLRTMVELSAAEHAGLIGAFSTLEPDIDLLLVDSAAGISDAVVRFCRAAQEVLVVVCDEPASITDAYALVKLLNREYGVRRFRVVANMVAGPREGRALFDKMVQVADRFLDEVILDYAGAVPNDDYLRRAVKRQRAVVEAYPRSPAAIAFGKMAREMDAWPVPRSGRGDLTFFIERLVRGEPVGGLEALI